LKLELKHALVVVSGKGGTGKTFVSANLGYLLAEAGNAVVLVDGDLLFACLSRLFDITDVEVDLVRIVSNGIPIWRAIYATRVHNNLGIIPVRPFKHRFRRFRFKPLVRMFKSISDKLDYIIIDMGQGAWEIMVDAMESFKEYLIVVESDVFWGLDAAVYVKGTGDEVKAKPAGFILNDVENTGILKPEVIKSFERILEIPFLGEIPHDPAVKDSINRLEILAKTKPKSPASIALRKIALKIMGFEIPEKQKKKTGFISKIFKSKGEP